MTRKTNIKTSNPKKIAFNIQCTWYMQIPASVFFYPSIFLYGYYALHSPPSPHPLCSQNPPSLGNSVLNALEKCMGYAKEIIVFKMP